MDITSVYKQHNATIIDRAPERSSKLHLLSVVNTEDSKQHAETNCSHLMEFLVLVNVGSIFGIRCAVATTVIIMKLPPTKETRKASRRVKPVMRSFSTLCSSRHVTDCRPTRENAWLDRSIVSSSMWCRMLLQASLYDANTMMLADWRQITSFACPRGLGDS